METSRQQGLIKPVLTALGIGMLVLGSFAVVRIAWLGGAEIIVGVLALLALSARPRSAQYAGLVMGLAVLLLWLIAVSRGVVGWLSWVTLAFAVAFVLGALTAPRIT
jgi:hypothetical protein